MVNVMRMNTHDTISKLSLAEHVETDATRCLLLGGGRNLKIDLNHCSEAKREERRGTIFLRTSENFQKLLMLR